MIEDLPPLPSRDDFGPEACAVISLYLAVWDDLSFAQQRQVGAHTARCKDCAREQQQLQRATSLVAMLATSSPSARVDEAVMAAIAARNGHNRQPAEPLRSMLQRGVSVQKTSRR